jgi:hypothetical protein
MAGDVKVRAIKTLKSKMGDRAYSISAGDEGYMNPHHAAELSSPASGGWVVIVSG